MKNRESRISTSFEVRSEDDGVAVVEGYAAVFNEDTIIGGQWQERIAQGAFKSAVGRDDVVFLSTTLACRLRGQGQERWSYLRTNAG